MVKTFRHIEDLERYKERDIKRKRQKFSPSDDVLRAVERAKIRRKEKRQPL